MGLVNFKTDLKSLKYGKDRVYMGDSGQPYVETPLPEKIKSNLANKDFILRGGLKVHLDVITDVKRLTKWFFDVKNPSGYLFITKQNLLSRVAVRTQTSGVGLNEGVYTPATTLAQAGLGLTGTHIPKQGLVPFKGTKTYGPNPHSYLSDNASKTVIGGEETGQNNRLVLLTDTKINNSFPVNKKGFYNLDKDILQPGISDRGEEIFAYGGGPGSKVGIGKTRISFAHNFQGAALRTGINSIAYGLLDFWQKKTYNNFSQDTGAQLQNFILPLYTKDNDIIEKNENLLKLGIINEDFSKTLIQKNQIPISTIFSISPSYKPGDNKTIDGYKGSRINYASPGQKSGKNLINYSKGSGIGPIDKINAYKIYQSDSPLPNENTQDLIPFYISSIIIKDGGVVKYNHIHFRAYISSMQDKYKAKWNSIKYMGRGENFYKYDGFDRDMSLDFIVAAQSVEEMKIQYDKLNYLASNLAPTYSSRGYMGGSLVNLTIGNWVSSQMGFIDSLSLKPSKDSPWEIGINDEGEVKGNTKNLILPHYVDVSLSFTPIHNFRVERQKLDFIQDDNFINPRLDQSTLKKQRFLSQDKLEEKKQEQDIR